MSATDRPQALRSGFARAFWVANTLELFERLAFYGSKAILAVYLVEKVGLGRLGSALVGLYGFAVFFLPTLAGPLVDRYGFRRSLIACFSIFSVGYFAIGLAGLPQGQAFVASIGLTPYIVGALLLTAVGGSLIKPCVVGTVARTTTPETKSLGYSIYYTLVNLGGAMGPVLGLQVREGFGIEYVLIMSALTSVLNLLGTFLFFPEPGGAAEGSTRTLGQVVRDMGMVFRNLRFMGFLVIFSGFWIMFWQIFYGLPFYVRDVLHFSRFELIETVDSCAIILLTVPVTALMKKVRPILAMSSGFAMASLGWCFVGAVPTLGGTIAGIVIFAVGEAMQAPRFYEYVADLAPTDQVGTYMGFAFLPVAIGALVAGYLSGFLVEHFMRQSHRPGMMWFALASVGLASTALMLLYDRFVVPRRA
ncbi:MFS transporter [Geothrix sp. 21YS21S-4]|uniref:MFS transporter n=1 Tax=Geothrix sp. 21YS21S-4 TaxID=3068889 RepID=UPI0027B94310|nr:MFS transporter [Geothrix sp. 21YS21S-4]